MKGRHGKCFPLPVFVTHGRTCILVKLFNNVKHVQCMSDEIFFARVPIDNESTCATMYIENNIIAIS